MKYDYAEVRVGFNDFIEIYKKSLMFEYMQRYASPNAWDANTMNEISDRMRNLPNEIEEDDRFYVTEY